MKSIGKYNKSSSVVVAKQRLHKLLSSDRINCSPDLMNQMREDIFHTISKYIEIEPQNFEMTLTRKEMQIRYTGEK